ncbi:hypothetical protein TNCV_4856111 [Trichonephila clavipes]|nr:hypothetical protein TNCV_4856111 [Trichonephila clavipes]
MDSWPACHEFETSTAEDQPYKEDGCTLNMPKLKLPNIDVVWNFKSGRQLKCFPRHLTMIQNYEVWHKNPLNSWIVRR